MDTKSHHNQTSSTDGGSRMCLCRFWSQRSFVFRALSGCGFSPKVSQFWEMKYVYAELGELDAGVSTSSNSRSSASSWVGNRSSLRRFVSEIT